MCGMTNDIPIHPAPVAAAAMPRAVRQAVYGQFASLAAGLAVNAYQFLSVENSASWVDGLLTALFVLVSVLIYWQITQRRNWARMAYILLTVGSYGLGALDPMGMSKVDVVGLALTVPIDIFVLLRLFGASATHWFLPSRQT
jgi:hypothetical protein